MPGGRPQEEMIKVNFQTAHQVRKFLAAYIVVVEFGSPLSQVVKK